MILFTGMYNVQNEDGSFIQNRLGDVEPGPMYTQAAINDVLPGFGAGFVAVALFFFAFTTIMAYYYILRRILPIVLLGVTFYGTVNEAQLAWAFGDVGLGLMVWLNIIAILILAKPAILTLKDYERQKKAGLDPVFDPKELGIKNATYWETEYKKDQDEAS